MLFTILTLLFSRLISFRYSFKVSKNGELGTLFIYNLVSSLLRGRLIRLIYHDETVQYDR